MNDSPTDTGAAVIVQARMGSSRLPGKSLADLGGYAVIDWVVQRSLMAHRVDIVVVATSADADDDPLAAHLESGGWHVVRGDLNDVLDRYATALGELPHDRLIRVTGDCPFVQPELIDAALDLLDGDVQYVYTGHDGRFPRGSTSRPSGARHCWPLTAKQPTRSSANTSRRSWPAAPSGSRPWRCRARPGHGDRTCG